VQLEALTMQVLSELGRAGAVGVDDKQVRAALVEQAQKAAAALVCPVARGELRDRRGRAGRPLFRSSIPLQKDMDRSWLPDERHLPGEII